MRDSLEIFRKSKKVKIEKQFFIQAEVFFLCYIGDITV